MKPIYHFVASFVLSILFFVFSGNLAASFLAFSAGFFIDLDHLIDFWALKPKNPFSIKDFLDEKTYEVKRKWSFVFLHSWELIAILWTVCYFANWHIYLLAITIGFSLHLLLDIYNLTSKRMSLFSYFLAYRIARRFKLKCQNPNVKTNPKLKIQNKNSIF